MKGPNESPPPVYAEVQKANEDMEMEVEINPSGKNLSLFKITLNLHYLLKKTLSLTNE